MYASQKLIKNCDTSHFQFQSFKIKQNKMSSGLPIVNIIMLMQWNLKMLFLDLIFPALPWQIISNTPTSVTLFY